MEIDADLENALHLLQQAKTSSGQPLAQAVRGFSMQQELNYWDYISLDILLGLQKTRTAFPDEVLFVVYHQIVELYFKLMIHEIGQLAGKPARTPEDWEKHVRRILEHLSMTMSGFELFADQLDAQQFGEFRLALAPASGFQSFQFRKIELLCTPIDNLVHPDLRKDVRPESGVPELYETLYWKFAGRDLHTGRKSLMLRHFEDKYDDGLRAIAARHRADNLWTLFLAERPAVRDNPDIHRLLRELDFTFNVTWAMSHYKLAAKHLRGRGPTDERSTGGTNWRKFLPPKNQKIVFFPELWSADEKYDWGRTLEPIRASFQPKYKGTSVRESQSNAAPS